MITSMCCAAGDLAVLDPEVLAWLQDPQLVQDSKDVQSVYTLHQQLSRLGQQQVKKINAVGPSSWKNIAASEYEPLPCLHRNCPMLQIALHFVI